MLEAQSNCFGWVYPGIGSVNTNKDNSNRSVQDGRDLSIKAKNNTQLEIRSLAFDVGAE